MPLLPETLKVIEQVEQLSNRPVRVSEDPNLRVLATVRTARGSDPFHLVSYQPGREVDYLITYQLGFLLRTFSLDPNERTQVVSSPSEKADGLDRLRLNQLPVPAADFLFNSLITQLRTIPIGFRVDRWIASEFPKLSPAQTSTAKVQIAQNEQALAPELRRQFPKPVIDANSRMNAAFATFWADRLHERRYVTPYAALGYETAANELLSMAADGPASSDSSLIAAWAANLGLAPFFHFEPLS